MVDLIRLLDPHPECCQHYFSSKWT